MLPTANWLLWFRNKSVADEFANKNAASHSYGSYENLVNDKDVDAIYVATPHGLHHEHVLLCIENKKAVLCEKAFAINRKQAKEMIDAAKKKNVFLMEALWTKFLPNYAAVQKMIKEKAWWHWKRTSEFWIHSKKTGSHKNL